ncbi:MAG: helix-turn-helix domain-containing protein [Rhizobiaceae bacterium]
MNSAKSIEISNRWFPSCKIGANAPLLIDLEYDDFDKQAERLVGYDQSYLQLTPGQFRGRFFSGFLGADVSIHLEYCNQALEQRLGGDPYAYSFGIVLNDGSVFRANGLEMATDQVVVIPPGSSIDIYSPVDGAVMAIVIATDKLLSEPGLAPQAADWLLGIGRDIGFLQAPHLARRLREDAVRALESAGAKASDPLAFGNTVGNALVAGIVANLSLECACVAQPQVFEPTRAYMRFAAGRGEMRLDWCENDDLDVLTKAVGASKRSLEHAFSEQLSVGPLTYLRILRLHKVRHKLSNPEFADQSIGDIAASNGFWNWSRFSQAYKTHFGELPSEARKRLMA